MKRPHNVFDSSENATMCKFILNELKNGNRTNFGPCGNFIWKLAEKRKILKNRSYQSMRDHMRRIILPNLTKIPLELKADEIQYLVEKFDLNNRPKTGRPKPKNKKYSTRIRQKHLFEKTQRKKRRKFIVEKQNIDDVKEREYETISLQNLKDNLRNKCKNDEKCKQECLENLPVFNIFSICYDQNGFLNEHFSKLIKRLDDLEIEPIRAMPNKKSRREKTIFEKISFSSIDHIDDKNESLNLEDYEIYVSFSFEDDFEYIDDKKLDEK